MKIFFGVFIFIVSILVSHSTAIAAEAKLEAQLIDVVYPVGKEEGLQKSIRVRDVASGKMASITLSRPDKQSPLTGFFIIQFFQGDRSARPFVFFDGSNQPLFVRVDNSEGTARVQLARTEIKNAIEIESPKKSSAQSLAEKFLEKQNQKTKKAESVEKGPMAPVQKPTISAEQVAMIEKEIRKKQQEEEKRILQLEEEENRKRLELLKQQEALSAAQKAKRINQAKEFAASADQAYQAGDYGRAVELYEKAIQLDPSDDTYLYRYGVSLYKINEPQKSLAVLSVAEVPYEQSAEKDYYLGLIYLKLGDNQKAIKKFTDVREEENPSLSPTAAFLAANLHFKRQEFAEARLNAEYVLDKGSDPQMDKAAEDLIEQISKLENYYNSKKIKYAFTLNGGFSYDDNVLNVATNNSSTDTKAFRLNYGGSAKAIVHRTPTSDLGVLGSFNDYYSTKTNFDTSGSVQAADALELAVNVPYNTELAIGAYQGNFEISPYYKSIWLAVGGDKTREEILTQVGATLSGGVPLKSNLMLSGRLDVGSDKSKLETSTGNDDQDASRLGLTMTPTWLLDLKGEKRLALDVGYTMNNAAGDNYKYNKILLAAAYTKPWLWSADWTYRFEYYNQAYPSADSSRTDSVATVSVNLSKEIQKDLNLNSGFTYVYANSDLDSYKYNKWILSSLFTWSHNILSK